MDLVCVFDTLSAIAISLMHNALETIDRFEELEQHDWHWGEFVSSLLKPSFWKNVGIDHRCLYLLLRPSMPRACPPSMHGNNRWVGGSHWGSMTDVTTILEGRRQDSHSSDQCTYAVDSLRRHPAAQLTPFATCCDLWSVARRHAASSIQNWINS